MTTTAATETELERTVREEQEAHEAALEGEDAEKGKLFELPRIPIVVDEADPNVLKLNFSGTVELDRANPRDAHFYNSLRAGRDADLQVQAFVAGPQNTHRRDGEGNVDAVVQTKSLKIHSIEIADVT